MTIEEMALAKANSLAEEIQHCAQDLAEAIKIAYPKKRIFPVRDRLERVRRAQKKQGKFNMIFGPTMTALRISTIITQPIPKFITGTTNLSSLAIVGNGGNEEIIRLGTSFVTI